MKLPPQTIVASLLRRTEDMVNRQGWSQPTVVFALLHPQGRTLGAMEIPVELDQDDVGVSLIKLGMFLQSDNATAEAVIERSILDGLVGFAVAHESMTNLEMTPEELDAETKDLWDVPGSREIRVILAMDLLGRQYQVVRVRGMDQIGTPEFQTVFLGGQLAEGLHLMCLAIARKMPDGLDFVEALSKIVIPAHADMNEISKYADDPTFCYFQEKSR